jgi:hypothetical protein
VIFELERWLLLSWLNLLFNYEMRENREGFPFIFKQKRGSPFSAFRVFRSSLFPIQHGNPMTLTIFCGSGILPR